MKKYEYKAQLLGHVRGIGPLLESINTTADDGWKVKTLFMHESDSYILFERERTEMCDLTMLIGEPVGPEAS